MTTKTKLTFPEGGNKKHVVSSASEIMQSTHEILNFSHKIVRKLFVKIIDKLFKIKYNLNSYIGGVCRDYGKSFTLITTFF